jgi:hypothetical protein
MRNYQPFLGWREILIQRAKKRAILKMQPPAPFDPADGLNTPVGIFPGAWSFMVL